MDVVTSEISDHIAADKKMAKSPVIVFSLLVLLLACLAIFFYIQNLELRRQLETSSSEENRIQTEEAITFSEKTPEEKAHDLNTREINHFITEVLPTYPVMAEQISNETVTNVYVFGLDASEQPGRLIETKNQAGNSYYLVSDTVQTKLEGVTIDFEGNAINCTISQVVTVGNERNLVKKLADTAGYLIIESNQCDTFGGGESVAVFALSTGNKVRLSGNISLDFGYGITQQAISSSGLALGDLHGVYGELNPILVVEYGSRVNSGAGAIAFFDLQTGRRVGLQLFK